MRSRHIFFWFGLLSILAASHGCRSTGKLDLPEAVVETSVSEKFAERRPIDIAVMPVYSAPEEIPPVVRHLRDQCKRQILEKNYSPVSFQSIDEKLGAFPERRRFDLNQIRGNFDEDALLLASLDLWDKTHLKLDLTVIVSATFVLFDSRTGDRLWEYRVTNRSIPVPNYSPQAAEGAGYEAYVAMILAQEAFANFPVKEPPAMPPDSGE